MSFGNVLGDALGSVHPQLFRKLTSPLPLPFRFKLRWDALPRPSYAWCLYRAADEAKRLGLKRMSAIEFGVARGDGLRELERLARIVEREVGVGIDVYGFDLATGLPAPRGYKDLPFIWQEGEYRMDRAALERDLRRAKLVIGDVRKEVPRFLKGRIAPIGCCIFDLDLYSSTADALRVFDGPAATRLPRVFCFFDDVVGERELYNEHTGALLAIAERNRGRSAKLALVNGMHLVRKIPARWNMCVYVHHDVTHPSYTKHLQ